MGIINLKFNYWTVKKLTLNWKCYLSKILSSQKFESVNLKKPAPLTSANFKIVNFRQHQYKIQGKDQCLPKLQCLRMLKLASCLTLWKTRNFFYSFSLKVLENVPMYHYVRKSHIENLTSLSWMVTKILAIKDFWFF